jgi:hypothetical protein
LPLKAESASRFYLANQESEVVFDPHVPGSFGLLNYARIGATAFQRDAARNRSELLRSDSKGLSVGFKRTQERTAAALSDRAKHPWMR